MGVNSNLVLGAFEMKIVSNNNLTTKLLVNLFK